MSIMKIFSGLLATLMFVNFAIAEISDKDFASAMEKYLKTDAGQEVVGNSVQAFFRDQQKKAQAEQAKAAEKAMEAQFNNPIKVDVSNAPTKGPKNAKVTIVEYSDFECPYCSRGANTIEQVLKAYPKDVKVAFKNLPLAFHKNAKPAAIAALAADRQGKFWEMHDEIFKNQRKLNSKFYLDVAEKLKLDMDKFKKDLKDPKLAKQVDDDTREAQKIGISGTPGFLVGGVLVKGAYPFSHFKTIIDRHLGK